MGCNSFEGVFVLKLKQKSTKFEPGSKYYESQNKILLIID